MNSKRGAVHVVLAIAMHAAFVGLPGCFDINSKVGGGDYIPVDAATEASPTSAISVSPDGIDFGTSACDSHPADRVAVVVNTTSAPATWKASLGKGDTSIYRLPQTSGLVPAAGSALITVSVTAPAPGATDPYSDTLTISTDAPGDAPHALQLKGGSAAPTFTVSTTNLPFGKQGVAQTSNAAHLTITNTAEAPAPFTISSSNAAYAFNPSSFTLAPKAQQAVNVTFTPLDVGDLPGTATVTGPDATCSVQVGLTGTGQVVAKQLAIGREHTCALVPGGRVACWGSNGSGQLGAKTSDAGHLKPVLVDGITSAIAVGAGRHHTCALTEGGEVYCWGYGGDGSLGNNALDDSAKPVLALTNASVLGVGWHSTCAGVKGGAVYCWGGAMGGSFNKNNRSRIMTPTAVAGVTGVDEIVVGANTGCARTGGTVACWAGFGQSLAGITDATALAAGTWHACALGAGTASCWGPNNYAQLGMGDTSNQTGVVAVKDLTSITAISAGYSATCAVQGGQVYCWGGLDFLYPGNWIGGPNTTTPSPLPTITNAATVAVSRFHACVALANGAVQCWGRNGSGQLGDGTSKDSSTPVNVLNTGM